MPPPEKPAGKTPATLPPPATPDEINRQVQPLASAFAQQISLQVGASSPQFAEQVTSEHLTQILGAKEKQDERAAEQKRLETWLYPVLTLAIVFVVLLFVVIVSVIFLHWQKSEKLDLIIGLILGFGSGALTGFGVCKAMQSPAPKAD